MSKLVLACWAVVVMGPWQTGRERPVMVCRAIEQVAAAQGLDPWLLAAIAWHESNFTPGLVSSDGMDVGSMQVRTSIISGNPWVRGGKVCTRAWVKTVYGGVECGALVLAYSQEFFRYKYGPGPVRGRAPIGCYATGMSCYVTAGARGILDMRARLIKFALSSDKATFSRP